MGRKLGMTQVFDEDGVAMAVTVVEFLPMTVTQLKTPEKEGYAAVQIGVIAAKAKHLSKGEQGHLKAASADAEAPKLLRKIKEFRLDATELSQLQVGQAIDTSFVEAGLLLQISSTSKGKGFRSAIQRWNQSRGPMSHGSKSHRLPGSIGAGTTPGRVFKGLHMAGRTGNKTVTLSNLQVVRVFEDKNVVLIKGSVPGANGAVLTLKPMKLSMKQQNRAAKAAKK